MNLKLIAMFLCKSLAFGEYVESKDSEYLNNIGRGMFFRVMLYGHGKKMPIQKGFKMLGNTLYPAEIYNQLLILEKGSINEFIEGGNGPDYPTVCLNDKYTQDDLVCECIQKFGKKGILRINTSPFRMPASCKSYSVSEQDNKGFQTFTLK